MKTLIGSTAKTTADSINEFYQVIGGFAAWELIAIPHPGPSEAI